MAFQLDSGVYGKQRSLSDYMAQNDARDLAKAQAEQSIAASQAAVGSAKVKQEMETVGLGLAGATPEDYPARRAALIAKGVPPEKLPEQYSKDYVDAVMTKTGYKAKPSLAEQLMQPLSMMMQQPGQMPAPTQEAAPIQPGSITMSELQTPDQYQSELYDKGSTPQEAAAMEGFAKGAPVGQGPMLPAQIPDTNLSTIIQPQQTPAPYQPKTVGGAFEADKAAAVASAKASAPLSAKEQADIAIKQAPIDEAKKSKQRSQKGFDSIMEDMNQVYDDLDAAGAASSENKTWDENLKIYATKTNPIAQAVGSLGGTRAQSVIQRLDPLKTRAKEQIMLATGMSSKAIDSNAEMKAFLASLTDVTNTREANAFTISTMQRLYGSPELAAARDAAIRSGQIEPMDFSKAGKSSGATGGASGGGGVTPMQIKGADDYNALPKGTVYLDPAGTQRTKQ